VKIVTADMIRELDRRAMSEGGMPGVVLMENAGRAVVAVLNDRYGPLSARSFHIACGIGNNGGDGFVVARHLLLAGAKVTVAVIGDRVRIHGDARVHFDLLTAMGVRLSDRVEAGDSIKIDALLGTGISGAPRQEVADAIESLNRAPAATISVDVPSGVDADTGATMGVAVRADATVTFAYPKLGLFLSPAADLAGEIVVDPIGFDWDSLGPSTVYSWLRAAEMRALLPPRPRAGHKGTFGHVLIVGGSSGMSGAPIMTARAAARAGSGLVTAAVPCSIQPQVAAGMCELMTVPLPESSGTITEESALSVLDFAECCDAVCLGPGMRNTSSTRAFVARLSATLTRPIVFDADALNGLAEDPSILSSRTAPALLTPHPGECARLLGISTADVEADRISAARETACRYRSVVVLKGARTVICDGRGNAEPPIGINTTGNAGMATGGSGDTLTGILGSLIGQGVELWNAARLGVFIHARAGDLAAAHRGERGLVATDITEMVPFALRELEESS
jgi:ADP-dependent NAD(P)H-hydrate dehydratase / NAD(P)H-hydrate epimerase